MNFHLRNFSLLYNGETILLLLCMIAKNDSVTLSIRLSDSCKCCCISSWWYSIVERRWKTPAFVNMKRLIATNASIIRMLTRITVFTSENGREHCHSLLRESIWANSWVLQTIEPITICDQFAVSCLFRYVCHISIFIFKVTICDLKRVVTYYCMQK